MPFYPRKSHQSSIINASSLARRKMLRERKRGFKTVCSLKVFIVCCQVLKCLRLNKTQEAETGIHIGNDCASSLIEQTLGNTCCCTCRVARGKFFKYKTGETIDVYTSMRATPSHKLLLNMVDTIIIRCSALCSFSPQQCGREHCPCSITPRFVIPG